MPKVIIDTPAPDFALDDFLGSPCRLSDFFGNSSVLLVFNRGFA